MKIKNILLAAVVALSATWQATAQSAATKAMKEEYNYRRSLECLAAQDYDGEFNYLLKAIEANPGNGYAHFKLGWIYYNEGDIEKCFASYAKALQSPTDDYELQKDTYLYMAHCHRYMGDMAKAKEEAKKCIEAGLKMPLVEASGYWYMSQLYQQEHNYAEAAKYAKLAIDTDPSDGLAYEEAINSLRHMGKEHYEEAEEIADKALTLWPYDQELKLKKANILLLEGRYTEAVDMAISVLRRQNKRYWPAVKTLCGRIDSEVYSEKKEIEDLDIRKLGMASTLKLEEQILDQPNSALWHGIMAFVQDDLQNDATAAEHFKKAWELDPSDNIYPLNLVVNLREIMAFDEALEVANKLVEQDSTNGQFYCDRALVKEYMGADKSSILADYDMAVKLNPMNDSYFRRGQYEKRIGMTDKAAEDLAAAIEMTPGDPILHKWLGDIFTDMSNKEMAQEEYEKCMEIIEKQEKEPNADVNLWCKSVILFRLGERDEALAAMEEDIDSYRSDRTDVAQCHMAEIYSLLGRNDDAIEALTKSFEAGNTDFYDARHSDELAPLRAARPADFEALVSKYEQKAKDKLTKKNATKAEAAARETRTSEIPFNHEGGVLTVPCVINGLPLSFIFDSGAADVTISQVEASFMIKNGYIKKSDIGGKEYYQTADGNVSVGTKLLLRSVTFGGETLTDVWASVVESQRAPLLLGQTVMKRLGKVEIDNTKQVIRITN